MPGGLDEDGAAPTGGRCGEGVTLSGSLSKLETGVPGLPENRFRI